MAQWAPLWRQKNEGVKIVTLFSHTVWPTAMKFGTMMGIGACQMLRDFAEL